VFHLGWLLLQVFSGCSGLVLDLQAYRRTRSCRGMCRTGCIGWRSLRTAHWAHWEGPWFL